MHHIMSVHMYICDLNKIQTRQKITRKINNTTNGLRLWLVKPVDICKDIGRWAHHFNVKLHFSFKQVTQLARYKVHAKILSDISRNWLKSQGENLGESWLFYGCRHKDKDFLFRWQFFLYFPPHYLWSFVVLRWAQFHLFFFFFFGGGMCQKY